MLPKALPPRAEEGQADRTRWEGGTLWFPISHLSILIFAQKIPKDRQRGEMERLKVVRWPQLIPVTKQTWHWASHLCTLAKTVII